MSDTKYDRITTFSILASIASVLLYDHLGAWRWLAITGGAVSGLVAICCYFYQKLSTSEVAEQDAPAALLPEGASVAPLQDQKGAYVMVVDDWGRAGTEMLDSRGWSLNIVETKFAEYTQHLWTRRLREHSAAGVSVNHLILGVKEVPDPRAMADAAVHIANRLASDKFEVVLSPQGQIVVRPCSFSLTDQSKTS